MANRAPTIIAGQIRLLERLCNANAVSGDEGEVRRIVLKEVASFADTVEVDPLGSVLVMKSGKGPRRLRVMLDAHMDEVGLMLAHDEGEGLFRFEVVGAMDPRALPGKQVLIGKERVPGVIGARAFHLTTPEERQKKIGLDVLRIDVGSGGAGKVNVGERATFGSQFCRVGQTLFGKALDNRIGVATLIALLKAAPRNVDLCLSFSVQKEIGMRGAGVAAHRFCPDIAFIVDATPANDLPAYDSRENVSYNARLGKGPAISTFDAGSVDDRRLVEFLVHTADDTHIPWQYRQPAKGWSNPGAIHQALAGIPTAGVLVPSRYPHTAMSVSRIEDWKNVLALLQSALERVTPALLNERSASG